MYINQYNLPCMYYFIFMQRRKTKINDLKQKPTCKSLQERKAQINVNNKYDIEC